MTGKQIESPIFTPVSIGPVTLRNRVIRSAAFENMAYGNSPSQDLYDYHVAVARGGVGMTTLAYASVNRSGLSFDGQLWMREEIVPGLKRITDAVHAAGAKCSIQLGHCGNMTHRATCGCMPVGASSGFNLYSPTFVRGLKISEIDALVEDFGHAVDLAREAGFDCVEIHAGHGYLISQFLSPYTNHRHDEYGGSLENRMRLMQRVIRRVLEADLSRSGYFEIDGGKYGSSFTVSGSAVGQGGSLATRVRVAWPGGAFDWGDSTAGLREARWQAHRLSDEIVPVLKIPVIPFSVMTCDPLLIPLLPVLSGKGYRSAPGVVVGHGLLVGKKHLPEPHLFKGGYDRFQHPFFLLSCSCFRFSMSCSPSSFSISSHRYFLRSASFLRFLFAAFFP